MAIELTSFIAVLEDSYSAYYNIIKENLPQDLPIAFRADYFQRGEKYWISKNIPIWGNETNEYAYIFTGESLDKKTIERCVEFALGDGLPRVKPHKEHQYTNIKVIFVANKFEDEAISYLKTKKFSKNYHWSLWGYTELITCAVDVNDERVATNPAGLTLKDYFKKLFAAQHKA